MLPMRLTPVDPEVHRRRYKIVRTDTMQDLPGLILSASVETGLCMVRNAAGDSIEHNFGPFGLRIVTR